MKWPRPYDELFCDNNDIRNILNAEQRELRSDLADRLYRQRSRTSYIHITDWLLAEPLGAAPFSTLREFFRVA